MSDSRVKPTGCRNIAVVTGTRAEFGLLRPVMRAIALHPSLDLHVISCGEHCKAFKGTETEVKNGFDDAVLLDDRQAVDEFRDAISLEIEMNNIGTLGLGERLGIGILTLASHFAKSKPNFVVVLGDRIEAFAAAAAASVAGIRVAHMHGGDRAEGVADEAMRHAITKLAHIHLPATQHSALRIIAMGEDPQRIHVVGSPAIDGLSEIKPLDDRAYEQHGRPQIIVLLHPTGDADDTEHERAAALLGIAEEFGDILALLPNHDPGHEGIRRAVQESGCESCVHLPREQFVGLLRRVKLIVGNSSAGLIEGAAIPVRCINIGRRQAGREMPANVINIPDWDYQTIRSAIANAMIEPPLEPSAITHPYGDGHAGPRTAAILASLDLNACPVAKRNAY